MLLQSHEAGEIHSVLADKIIDKSSDFFAMTAVEMQHITPRNFSVSGRVEYPSFQGLDQLEWCFVRH